MQEMWRKMRPKWIAVGIMFGGFVFPVYATDQLIAENPDEPNLFGYFVMVMSIAIMGSFLTLKIKKWRKRK